MVDRTITTTDPREARRQRERVADLARKRRALGDRCAAEAADADAAHAERWAERRTRGEVPGLVRRVEDRTPALRAEPIVEWVGEPGDDVIRAWPSEGR